MPRLTSQDLAAHFGQQADGARARRAGGARAKAAGNHAEERLDAQHKLYRMYGDAIIDKCHPRVYGKPGQMQYGGKAPIDYAGCLKGGRAVFLELKHSGEAKASLDLTSGGKGRVGSQVDELVARHEAGAVAVLVWHNGDRLGLLAGSDLKAWVGKQNVPKEAFAWGKPGAWDWLVGLDTELHTR